MRLCTTRQSAGAEYVELYNTSGTITFDLSGWQLPRFVLHFPARVADGAGQFSRARG